MLWPRARSRAPVAGAGRCPVAGPGPAKVGYHDER